MKNLQVIGCDGANVNTGIRKFEESFNIKMMWIYYYYFITIVCIYIYDIKSDKTIY